MALGAAAAASGGGAVTLRGRASVAWLQRVSVARPAERRFLSPLTRFFVRSLALSLGVAPVCRCVPTHPNHKDGDQTGHHLPENPPHCLLLRLLGRKPRYDFTRPALAHFFPFIFLAEISRPRVCVRSPF